MATDYGKDMSGGVDLTPTLLDVTGDELMRQVALRRLYTPNASLLSSPDETTCDLREFLSTEQGLRESDLRTIKATATSALLADPRIFAATVLVDEWDPVSGTLVLRVTCDGATGPFRLVIQVTSLTIDVLE